MLKALFPQSTEPEVVLTYPTDKMSEEDAQECAEYEAEFCGKRVKPEHWLAANLIGELYAASGYYGDDLIKSLPNPASYANQNLQLFVTYNGKVFRVLYDVEPVTIDLIHTRNFEDCRYDVVGINVAQLAKDYSENLFAVTTALVDAANHLCEVIDFNIVTDILSVHSEAACPGSPQKRGVKRPAAPMTSAIAIYDSTPDEISSAFRKRCRKQITLVRRQANNNNSADMQV
jgi:hypothetical protein